MSRILWALAGVALIALVGIVMCGFSFDMDEFLPYHTIACEQPGQLLSVYQGACNDLPTSFFIIRYDGVPTRAKQVTLW
jgi:hypothetical protein